MYRDVDISSPVRMRGAAVDSPGSPCPPRATGQEVASALKVWRRRAAAAEEAEESREPREWDMDD